MLRSMLLFGGSGGMATDPHGLHARLSALSRAHLPDHQDAKRQRDGVAKNTGNDGDSGQHDQDDTSEKGGGELDMMWEDSVHFADHDPIKQRVQKRVEKEERADQVGGFGTTLGKAAKVATVTAMHGTEELLEVLTTEQGRQFVRAMTVSVINGYLECGRSNKFRAAARAAAEASAEGMMKVSEREAAALERHIATQQPVSTCILRCWFPSPFLVTTSTLLLALGFTALILMWKVILLGHC